MKLTVKETVIFGMLGAILYAVKAIMEAAPNIHLVGTLIVAYTVMYRKKALYPIYIYVLLCGLFGGFNLWWLPYLYVWTVLWGAVMLLPKNMPDKLAVIVYAIVCSLYGFLFGVIYAPAQALIFGLDFKGTVAWIASGLTFDMIHGVSNFCCGLLILPIIKLLKRIETASRR